MTNEKWVKTSIANMKVGDVVRKAERYRSESELFPGYDGRRITVSGFCNEMWEGFSIKEDFDFGSCGLYYCRVEQADDEWEKLVIEEEPEFINGFEIGDIVRSTAPQVYGDKFDNRLLEEGHIGVVTHIDECGKDRIAVDNLLSDGAFVFSAGAFVKLTVEEVQEWIDGLVTEIDNLEVETGKKESYLYDAYTYLYKENDKNVIETVTISIDKEYAEKIIEAVRVMESYGATMVPVFNDLFDLIKNSVSDGSSNDSNDA